MAAIISCKMAPSFPPLTFSLFLLVLSVSAFSSSVTSSNFADSLADKLIRDLNLSPKHEVNIVPPGTSDTTQNSRLVEKKINLPVLGDSGATVKDLGQHAGFFRLPHSKDARLFYYFFESRNSKDDPVVIWLTGGPGCSSAIALFYENGPFHITKNMSLSWNSFGWDKVSNIIYVDQPVGTGFSYSSAASDIRSNEKGVSDDLYDFLQEFFKAHPNYTNNEFFITGESYAGHYIPAFASRVHQGNKDKEGIPINLKGFAIGNGLTDPAIQYKAYTDFSLDNKIISKSDHDSINKLVPECEKDIKLCATVGNQTCLDAFDACTAIFGAILDVAGNINYYDIRKQCDGGGLCYDFSRVDEFLNLPSVKEALGVHTDYVTCSSIVYNAMQGDWMKDLEVGIPALLEDGVQVLIYAGEYDLICNWLGNSRWVHAMNWSGQKNFTAAPTVPFSVAGAEAGIMQSYGPLTFLKVHNAGLMVPTDQPKASLKMLTRWMQEKLAAAHKQD
ncbi:serine carboxypeptidase-like isoform X2 [Daucus carota subsp. sativus]|uniref:serine carboxypeptidase-like isoform X2 n=1 Tax=Daucus carota subsp. sativus TaxID=79200 RepID=UPI003083D169